MHRKDGSVYRSVGLRRASVLLVVAMFAAGCFPCASNAQTSAGPHRKVVYKVEPEYPEFLRNGHFEGTVRLKAIVRPNGTVASVQIEGGNPILAEYSQKAVMRWKYVAAPEESTEQVVIIFHSASQ
jgi:TonB family protein